MITVDKHGNKPTYTGACMKCGCQISCGTEDLQTDMETSGMQKFVYCPECGEKILITGSYIPTGFGVNIGKTNILEVVFKWKQDLALYASFVKEARSKSGYSYNTYIYHVLEDLENDLLALAKYTNPEEVTWDEAEKEGYNKVEYTIKSAIDGAIKLGSLFTDDMLEETVKDTALKVYKELNNIQ